MRDILKLAAAGILAIVMVAPTDGCSKQSTHHSYGILRSGQAPGALLNLTWNGSSCLGMDGGAGDYPGDPFPMGGNQGVFMSGATITCTAPSNTVIPASGSVRAQLSNEAQTWFEADVVSSTIDGGMADGGIPAALVIPTQSASFARVVLTSVAVLLADAGFFCDAGADGGTTNDGGYFCDAGATSYIDSGTNFCDGGNFCDAGPGCYQGGGWGTICVDLNQGQPICCNAVTVPE